MKCLNKILIMTLLLSLFSGGIINKTIINAEDTNDVDIVQPCYQTLSVKKLLASQPICLMAVWQWLCLL